MSKDNTKKSGTKTLLWSVIMSAPGPLIIGLGLMVGRSSTQIADFVRRSSELLAIIMAYAIVTPEEAVNITPKVIIPEKGTNKIIQ